MHFCGFSQHYYTLLYFFFLSTWGVIFFFFGGGGGGGAFVFTFSIHNRLACHLKETLRLLLQLMLHTTSRVSIFQHESSFSQDQ